jgi:hypothetical protein
MASVEHDDASQVLPLRSTESSGFPLRNSFTGTTKVEPAVSAASVDGKAVVVSSAPQESTAMQVEPQHHPITVAVPAILAHPILATCSNPCDIDYSSRGERVNGVSARRKTLTAPWQGPLLRGSCGTCIYLAMSAISITGYVLMMLGLFLPDYKYSQSAKATLFFAGLGCFIFACVLKLLLLCCRQDGAMIVTPEVALQCLTDLLVSPHTRRERR